jgi:hypothetical protein
LPRIEVRLIGGDRAPGSPALGRYNLRERSPLLVDDFASSALRAFRELNPRTLFAMNWHIELIAAQLAAVRAGRIRRLLVNKTYHMKKRNIFSTQRCSDGPSRLSMAPGWNVTGNAPAPPMQGQRLRRRARRNMAGGSWRSRLNEAGMRMGRHGTRHPI